MAVNYSYRGIISRFSKTAKFLEKMRSDFEHYNATKEQGIAQLRQQMNDEIDAANQRISAATGDVRYQVHQLRNSLERDLKSTQDFLESRCRSLRLLDRVYYTTMLDSGTSKAISKVFKVNLANLTFDNAMGIVNIWRRKFYKYDNFVIFRKRRRRIYRAFTGLTLWMKEEIKEAKKDGNERIGNARKAETLKQQPIIENARAQCSNAINIIEATMMEKMRAMKAQIDNFLGETYSSEFLNLLSILGERGKYPSAPSKSYEEAISIGELGISIKHLLEGLNYRITGLKEAKQVDDILFIPALVSLTESLALFFEGKAPAVKQAMEVIIESFLHQIPVNTLELAVFDPEKKGTSVATLLELFKVMPEIFEHKIATTAADIHDKLMEFNQFINITIQQKLGNRFTDVYSYNEATPANVVPHRLLVIYDFPKSFERNSLEMLVDVIENAGKCGISVLIHYNPTYESEIFSDGKLLIDKIKSNALQLSENKGVFFINGTEFFVPHKLPTNRPEYYELYCQTARADRLKGIAFRDLLTPESYCSRRAQQVISLPIGQGDGSRIHNLTLGLKASHHGIIAGATGSGKSTLMHTMIMSALVHYAPDEMHLYLLDFKSGTEFKVYETARLPHIKLLAIDAMPEFGESIFEELVQEMQRRADIFKENGIKNITDWNLDGVKMPRILILVDEFQIVFNEKINPRVAANCAMLMGRLVTEGRAYGINIIMATQTFRNIRENCSLNMSTMEQMRVRIGLKCAEEEARMIFGENNTNDALSRMKGAIGVACYNQDFVEGGNESLRVAYCSSDEQQRLLGIIADKCANYPANMRVFEGSRVPVLPRDEIAKNVASGEFKIVLGEPIRVSPPLTITFSRRRNQNILIVGGDHKLMTRLVETVLVNVNAYPQVKTYYLDGNQFIEEPLTPELGQLVTCERVNVVDSIPPILDFIEKTHAELVNRRQRQGSDDPLFIIINNLQNLDVIKTFLKDEYFDASAFVADPFAMPLEYSRLLKDILENGYAFNIHALITASDYATISEFQYTTGLLKKLNNRIIFRLSEADCFALIDGVKTDGLNNITATYTDGIKQTFQFKPYLLNLK